MKYWTKEKITKLGSLYPNISNKELAETFGVSVSSIRNQATNNGFCKSVEFGIAQRKVGQFKKGSVPINKGKKIHEYMSPEAIAKSAETRFKKGQKPANTVNNGYERINIDGYVEVKTNEKFVFKHRLVWQEENGEIPDNSIVVFRDGNKQNFNINNLELITRAQLMMRNTISQYPAELQTTIILVNKINKNLHDGKK